MKTVIKWVQIGVFIVLGAKPLSVGGSTLQFTATQATAEQAIQVRWQSESNAVYRLEYTPSLSDSIVWQTLVDSFPSQGTNTEVLPKNPTSG
jgi:hypothetical protein